jgi:hypothetical protein
MAKKMSRQQRKFQTVARHCHAKLRAGALPRKGGFGSCMRTGMKKRGGR